MRSPEGGYSERHLPINAASAYTLTARQRDQVYEEGADVDENGVARDGSRLARVRARLSRGMFSDNIQKPTAAELDDAHHHADEIHELEHAMEGHSADGHQFDGRHPVDGEELRQH